MIIISLINLSDIQRITFRHTVPEAKSFFFYKVVKLESSREKMGAAGKSVEFQSESYYFTFRRSAEHCNSPNCNYNRPPLLLGWMVHRLYLSAAQLNAQKRDRPGQGFTQQGNCCGSINRLLHFFFIQVRYDLDIIMALSLSSSDELYKRFRKSTFGFRVCTPRLR